MSKYKAKACFIDGTRFASQAEGRRYGELKLLEKAGKISCLVLQPAYPIVVNGISVGSYFADFRYLDNQPNQVIVEDVKGVLTPLFNFKRKCVEAQYGIKINIVKMTRSRRGKRK